MVDRTLKSNYHYYFTLQRICKSLSLSLSVFVSVSVCECMCASVHACMYACVCARASVCVRACLHACMSMPVCVCMPLCVCVAPDQEVSHWHMQSQQHQFLLTCHNPVLKL